MQSKVVVWCERCILEWSGATVGQRGEARRKRRILGGMNTQPKHTRPMQIEVGFQVRSFVVGTLLAARINDAAEHGILDVVS